MTHQAQVITKEMVLLQQLSVNDCRKFRSLPTRNAKACPKRAPIFQGLESVKVKACPLLWLRGLHDIRSADQSYVRWYALTSPKIPSPHLRSSDEDDDPIKPTPATASSSGAIDRSMSRTRSFSKAASMDRAVSSIFVLGRTPSRSSDARSRISEPISLASLSYEELGGVEYSALRVLLNIVAGQSHSFFSSRFM